jgi:hypothetical protein
MSSLFDEPVGPPGPIPPEEPPPKPRKPRVRKFKVDRGGDADLDDRLADLTPDVIDPGYDGHMMRVAGRPWAEIADAIGSPTASAAMFTVSRYLTEAAKNQSAQHQQEALQTQVDRYEALLRSWWSLATDGHDEKAAGVVLRALERLDRVLRLTDDDISVSRETIVVSGNQEEYVKQLQAVVAGRETGNSRN